MDCIIVPKKYQKDMPELGYTRIIENMTQGVTLVEIWLIDYHQHPFTWCITPPNQTSHLIQFDIEKHFLTRLNAMVYSDVKYVSFDELNINDYSVHSNVMVEIDPAGFSDVRPCNHTLVRPAQFEYNLSDNNLWIVRKDVLAKNLYQLGLDNYILTDEENRYAGMSLKNLSNLELSTIAESEINYVSLSSSQMSKK